MYSRIRPLGSRDNDDTGKISHRDLETPQPRLYVDGKISHRDQEAPMVKVIQGGSVIEIKRQCNLDDDFRES
jgi:hypothetical protein